MVVEAMEEHKNIKKGKQQRKGRPKKEIERIIGLLIPYYRNNKISVID